MKELFVAFCDRKLEAAFEKLRSEDRRLYDSIDGVISRLKKDPASGVKIPRRLWPKVYVVRERINNLWKHDLCDGWRLIYTVRGDEVMILSVILEWMSHKNYERRFNY